jgi:hypothetical protein
MTSFGCLFDDYVAADVVRIDIDPFNVDAAIFRGGVGVWCCHGASAIQSWWNGWVVHESMVNRNDLQVLLKFYHVENRPQTDSESCTKRLTRIGKKVGRCFPRSASLLVEQPR